MSQRKRSRPRFSHAVVGLVSLIASGCASQTVTLVHPQSGAKLSCSASGSGVMVPVAGGFLEGCVRRAEQDGYVPVDQLTTAQRRDLEQRGILPKESQTPKKMTN